MPRFPGSIPQVFPVSESYRKPVDWQRFRQGIFLLSAVELDKSRDVHPMWNLR